MPDQAHPDQPEIRYERAAIPETPTEIAPGVFGIRLALPFALDHVHLWLLPDEDGWTVVDAGLADERTRAVWDGLLGDFCAGAPLRRVLVTHFHPDHMGLAGWLCARTGAELWTSRTEWLQGRMLAQDTSDAFVEAGRLFDHRAGLSEEQIAARAKRGNAYRTRAGPPPACYRRLRPGDRVRIGGADWRLLLGQGHSPEMLCLFDPERNLLLAGDQVLPRISPNVSVWPAEPLANPLQEFLASLQPFLDLPEDCLVLPSHGRPFRGLHARIEQLAQHHRERLDLVLEACGTPATTVEIMTRLFDRPLDAHQLGFALGESLAHINYLVEEGRLTRRLDDDGRLRYARS